MGKRLWVVKLVKRMSNRDFESNNRTLKFSHQTLYTGVGKRGWYWSKIPHRVSQHPKNLETIYPIGLIPALFKVFLVDMSLVYNLYTTDPSHVHGLSKVQAQVARGQARMAPQLKLRAAGVEWNTTITRQVGKRYWERLFYTMRKDKSTFLGANMYLFVYFVVHHLLFVL